MTTRTIRTIIIGAAALTLPLVALTGTAGASTSPSKATQAKFIKALHAWAPATKQHTNKSEVSEGETICRNLGRNGNEQADAAVGQPRGTTAVEETFSDFVNENSRVLINSQNSTGSVLAGQTLENDIFGVSVLELCPRFERAVKYLNSPGGPFNAGRVPTTSKPSKAEVSAGAGIAGYAYSATPPPPAPSPTTTTTTLVPTSPSQLGAPPGNGSAWKQAPPALVSAIQKAAAANPYGGAFASGSTYWISQDPNSPQWYYVLVDSPESKSSSFTGDTSSGIEELMNGRWVIVSGIGDQAPGCYGPENQDLPPGTSNVPVNVLSDFAQSCN